jgi:hypothetical protein
MLPFGRPLRVQLQAGCSPGMGDQHTQTGSSPLLTLRATLAPDSFRLGFPFALPHTLMGLVAMLVIRVHDAS